MDPIDSIDAVLTAALASDRLSVPAYPQTACQLSDALASHDFSFASVVRVVGQDQSLAASCLRLANSAAFGATTVTSLEVAVSRVGTEALRQLAFALGVGSQVSGAGPLAEIRSLFWRRATMSASLCRRMASRRGLVPDEAFLAGLLHDIGAIVITSAIESHLKTHPLSAPVERGEWLRLVEAHHTSAGDALARNWRLPELHANVIRWHHQPASGPPASRPMTELVELVDRVIAHLEEHSAPGTAEMRPPVDRGASGSDTALGEDELNAIIESLDAVAVDVSELSMGFSTPPTRGASAVAAAPSVSPPGIVPTNIAAVSKTKNDEVPCSVVGLARDALVVRGAKPLTLNALTLFEIRPTEGAPLTLWAVVTACQPDGPGWRIDTRPFGLSGEPLTRWISLLASARSPGQNGPTAGPSLSIEPPALLTGPPRDRSAPPSRARPSVSIQPKPGGGQSFISSLLRRARSL